jgi:hypothetical protein
VFGPFDGELGVSIGSAGELLLMRQVRHFGEKMRV